MSTPAEQLEESAPIGRPTDYRVDFCLTAHEMCTQGATEFELAEEFGVTPRTIYRWQAAHPEFRQALKLGREAADERVERSLYHRAVGYSYPAIKIMQDKGCPVIVPYTEHEPPDVGAATLWLTNRRSKDWKQTKTLEVKSDKSDADVIDAILARFQALKAGEVVEGEVVPSAARPGTSEPSELDATEDSGPATNGAPRLTHD
jgi:hypothetical protein